MTSGFLSCTICPKKPSFSDASHLLTHIGSKGHLAHLHSLQVRSHQEIGAARNLTAYNQWYDDHGLAALLSDRLQQKEQKQADKKAANRRRMVVTSNCKKDKPQPPAHKQADSSVSSAFPAEQQFPGTDSRSDQAEDSHHPIDRSVSHYPLLASSPPRSRTESREDDDEFVDVDSETFVKGVPGSPKLKGTQWPGMALFDAAPEDLRRKRNQRKDGSVLQKLEKNATLVQPTETVSSAVGTVLKHRHMDNLEDDSPVEGEELITEPTPKPRKTRGTRSRCQTSDTSNLKSEKPRRKRPFTPIKQSGSPTNKKARAKLPLPPAQKESDDFKLTFRKVERKKKKNTTFTIFEDSSPSIGMNTSRKEVPFVCGETNQVRPQLAVRPVSLMRDSTEPYDPFKSIRDHLPFVMSNFNELSQDKENYPAMFNGPGLDRHVRATVNPLYFHGDARLGLDDEYVHENRLALPITAHANPIHVNNTFMPTRNPLMLSMNDLDEGGPTQEEFGFDGTPSRYSRVLFAP